MKTSKNRGTYYTPFTKIKFITHELKKELKFEFFF